MYTIKDHGKQLKYFSTYRNSIQLRYAFIFVIKQVQDVIFK